MKNVIMVMAGGVGNRFNASIPKQYVILNGKMVIDYVLEAVIESNLKDQVVVVMDEQYRDLLKDYEKYDFMYAPNGKDRYTSVKNGFDVIKEKGGCDKVVIVDAVAPLITAEIIDDYFLKLDDYDAVITSQKITGAFTNKDFDVLNREDFVITQSPEGFKFDLIYNNFNPTLDTQELACHLPKNTKKFLNYGFKNNLKLTYNFDLEYASFMLKQRENEEIEFNNILSRDFFISDGIRDYLLRVYPSDTWKWLDNVFMFYKELVINYGPFTNVSLNQSSRFGLVMTIVDRNNKEFIVKMIPEFISRYESERDTYSVLSDTFMCPILDTNDQYRALFLKKLDVIHYAYFEDNIILTKFFDNVFDNGVKYTDDLQGKHFTDFYKQLVEKAENMDGVSFCKDDVKKCLDKSIKYYDDYFKGYDLYITHGDLRRNNILRHGNCYYAVDPIGYILPLVFDTARFIIDDVDDNKLFDMESRLLMLVNYFKRWFNEKDILMATYIFTAFITYNSTFENEDDVQTKNYIKLMDIIDKLIK